MATLNKQALIERLVEHNTFETKRAAGEVLDIAIDTIISALVSGDDVYLGQNFGGFAPLTRAARKGVNPSTGEALDIPETKTVKFKPSSQLKTLLNS